MGNIRKRGDNWYVDFRVNGRRVRKRAGKSKTLAQQLLHDYELKAQRNQLGFLDRKEIALDAFIQEFLTYSQAQNRPSTTKRYRSALDNFQRFIKEQTKVSRLTDLAPDLIEKYKTWRKAVLVVRNGGNLAKAKEAAISKGAKSYTVNFEIMALKAALNMAVKWKYLEASPAEEVKPLRVEDSKARRFLTEAECAALLESATEDFYPIVFTFLNTGMRRAELVNLEWDDIDFARSILKIRRKPFWMPKTGEREIPINPDLAVVLNRLPRKLNFVFTSKQGHQLDPDWVRDHLSKTAERSEVSSLTPHALRHTFASLLIKNGVDLPTVQKLMGHNSIETTMIYAHQTTDQLKMAVSKLGFCSPKASSCVTRIA